MIPRTPVLGKLPTLLLRNVKPPPTPVIDGTPVRTVSSMLDHGFTDEELEAVVELASVAPESDPAWSAAYPEVLKSSCAYFASEVLRGPSKEPYNGKFLLGRHHIEWDELIATQQRINILAARDHGKSYFFTFAYPIWKAGFNAPGSEGYIFSATEDQAVAFLTMIKEEIEKNQKLQHLLPIGTVRSKPGIWSRTQITLRNGSVIKARGFGTKVRGGHPDWVICDDVLNDDDIYSDLIRQRNIDYFLSAISGMVHPTDQLIVVGTPMHEMDLYGVLANTEQVLKIAGDVSKEDLQGYVYECRKYPCKDPETGELLFPERYDEKALKLKRIELKTAARFAREFLCEPLSDEASLFPAKLFRQDGMRQPYVLGLPAGYWEKQGCLRYTGVDIALSAETGADYFVIFTVAVDPRGNRWLANLIRHKGLAFHEQIELIKEENLLMRPEIIHIEANQAQRVWTDEVARTSDAQVRRFFTTGIGGRQPDNAWKKGATQVAVNKHHIDRGVPALRLSLEHNKWKIPRGDDNSIEQTNVWIKEMGCIGWIDGKVQTVAGHDDTVMACWMCDTAVRMGGVDLSYIDHEDEQSKDVLASPVVSTKEMPEHDFLVAERRALAAVQQGRRVVDVTADAYESRVRAAIKAYASDSYDQDEYARAARALQEIKRLDAAFGVRSADFPVGNEGSDGYVESDDSQGEGAPSFEDLGVI